MPRQRGMSRVQSECTSKNIVAPLAAAPLDDLLVYFKPKPSGCTASVMIEIERHVGPEPRVAGRRPADLVQSHWIVIG